MAMDSFWERQASTGWKTNNKEKWNQQMQKQQHKIIKKCENNCPKPNVSAESFMKLRGVHVNSRVLIAHGCSCVFFIFFSAATHLAYSVGFRAQKEKSK